MRYTTGKIYTIHNELTLMLSKRKRERKANEMVAAKGQAKWAQDDAARGFFS